MNDLFQKKLHPRFTNGRLYANDKIVPQETINNFLATESDRPSPQTAEGLWNSDTLLFWIAVIAYRNAANPIVSII